VAEYTTAEVALHWGPNTERDLRGYRLYRGAQADFLPGPENLIAATPDTGYVDHPGTCAVYYKLSAVDRHGNESHFALVTPAGPTATLASLVSAAYDRGTVRLLWSAAANPGLSATVYRRTASTPWVALGTVRADGTGLLRFEDAATIPNTRYGYRLGVFDGDHEVFVGEVWVEVPALDLALSGARPNPSIGSALRVHFTLPSAAAASLALYDVTGRRLQVRDVGTLGAGPHEVELAPKRGLAPGVYLLRLTQGARSLTTRAAVVK